jgi:hypothetical protein
MTEETKQPNKPAVKKRSQKRQELPPDEERSPGIAGNPNKYANRPKIGKPTIGKSPNYVESVGLGNLKVISANGNNDV